MGSLQLAADVEYFCNVMGALHVQPLPGLVTAQIFAGQAAEQFAESAQSAVEQEGVEVKVIKAIAAMRRLPLTL